MTKNRTFWKTIKFFLTNKTNTFPRKTLIVDEHIFSEDNEIAKTFSGYFINIATQNMPANQELEFLNSKFLDQNLNSEFLDPF